MSAISTVDLYTAVAASRTQRFMHSRTHPAFTVVADQLLSMWLGTGIPGPGVAPGAAAVPVKSTAGSLCNFTDPGGGEFGHLFELDYVWDASASGTIYLYDRLVHSGALSGLLITAQTINTPAITRGDTNGLGVEGFIECYVTLGSTTTTATISYTNTAGTAGRTATVTIPANYRAGRLLPISPLQGDDLGIKSIETLTLAASTLGAGDFGVTLARRICALPMSLAGSVQGIRSHLDLGLPRIATSACLWLAIQTETTSLSVLTGGIVVGTTGTAGAIANQADLTSAVLARAQTFDIIKEQTTTSAAGQFMSTWLEAGIPVAGAVPGATSVPTKDTVGALCDFANPGGGESAHIYQHDLTILSSASPIEIWDRLVHMGGLSGTDTALQTINTSAITRGDTNGVGAVGWIECYVQLGATPQTLTVSYTNTAGTAGRVTTVSIPATMRVGRMLSIPLLTGDFGIKSVETVQLGGSTGTAGSYGVTIGRRVLVVPIKEDNVPVARTGLEIGLCPIESNACLWLVAYANAGQAPDTTVGSLVIVTSG